MHRLRRPGGARRPDRGPPPRGRRDRARPLPGRAARRVPGHQPRPARPAAGAVRRRPSGDRRRRPVPVDLRLARRQRGQPAPLRPRLPGGHGQRPGPAASPAAVRQLSTSFRNTGRVLDAAAALQQGLRAEAPQVPRLVPPPAAGRARAGGLRAAGDRRGRGGLGRRRRSSALLALPPGVGPGRRALAGRPAAPASIRPTSRCSAASGPSSRRCGRRSRRAASRSRWSAWAGCSPCPRWPTSSRRCGCCTTRPRPARWPGCSPARGGGSARATWWPWAGGPATWPASTAPPGRPRRTPPGRPARRRGAGAGPDRARPPGPRRADDPLAKAVTDLTAEPGSLVEALDDLGARPAYSRGRVRAARPRWPPSCGCCARRSARPLPDLVGEVERALGLDIEVAARPRPGPGRRPRRPGRVRGRGGRVRRRPGGADARARSSPT